MGILVTCCLLAWDVFSFPLFAQTVRAGEGEDENLQREAWYSFVLSGHVHFWEKQSILWFADVLSGTNHSLIASHTPVYHLLQSLETKQEEKLVLWHFKQENLLILLSFTTYSICMLKRRLNLNSQLFSFSLKWAFWNMNIWGDKTYFTGLTYNG